MEIFAINTLDRFDEKSNLYWDLQGCLQDLDPLYFSLLHSTVGSFTSFYQISGLFLYLNIVEWVSAIFVFSAV